MKNTAVTLLYVSPKTATWMKAEAKKMNEKHAGAAVGLATLARAVLNGICESGLDLATCRGELDIQDLVQKLVATATTTEVK